MTLLSTLPRGALLLGIASLSLFAAPIVGILNIGGSTAVSLTQIDFLPPGVTPGTFRVDLFTQTGSFVPLADTVGSLEDLNSVLYPTGAVISFPNWLTFGADPNISFELTYIQPGSFSSAECGLAPASGQTCTLAGSPFNLSNAAAGAGINSTVSFGVQGIVHNLATAEQSTFSGTFSTQFVGRPYQSVLATISAGGSERATYSANFEVTAIPEPATLALCGSALLGLAFVRRRNRQR